MKKALKQALVKTLCLSMISTSLIVPVYANNEVEISFNLGASELNINGNKVTVPAPFVLGQGTTMVPLRVITEAFGAKVDWESSSKRITMQYDNSTIVMHINSLTATINGKEVPLSEAPIISEGSTMVPLRFISENFGATVGYNEATKAITVSKGETSASGKDDINIGDLLNVAEHEYIGDSSLNWSMKNSPSFKLIDRNFDATELEYAFENELAAMYINIANNDDDLSYDEAVSYFGSLANIYTLVSKEEKVIDGAKVFDIVSKSKNGTISMKICSKGDKLYTYMLILDSEIEKKDQDIALDVWNSISLSFDSNKDIEDLSNLSEGGKRSFEHKELNLALNFPKDWKEDTSAGKVNQLVFDKVDNNNEIVSSIYIKLYSQDKDQTVDNIAQQSAAFNKYSSNPKYYTQSPTSGKLGEYNYKGMSEQLTSVDNTKAYRDKYYISNYGYIYEITVFYYEQSDKDKLKDEVYTILSTMKLEKPEIGQIMDDSVKVEDLFAKTKVIEDKDLKVKYEIPLEFSGSGSGAIRRFYDYDNGISIVVEQDDRVLPTEEEFAKTMLVEVISYNKTSKRMGGMSATHVKGYTDSDRDEIRETFMVKRGSQEFAIHIKYAVYADSQMTKDLINKVISSVKFG